MSKKMSFMQKISYTREGKELSKSADKNVSYFGKMLYDILKDKTDEQVAHMLSKPKISHTKECQ